jgi:predicted ABC-type transport system involved in lysophospholipase L1 biosynthesis ATPase subunit
VAVAELVVTGVSHGIPTGKGWVPVLRDVSFEVDAGEVVAIVGGRGAGKTTMLKIAAGVGLPEEGSVRLGDREITRLSDDARVCLRGRDRELVWLNRAGMSQKLSVSRIVGWALVWELGWGGAERRAVEMLERVGATDCTRYRWADLSRWEQLLVGLAQAFVVEPRIIVVDDLLDGLGWPATEEAFKLVRSLMHEAARPSGVLISASDSDSALYADRVWALDADGRLTPTAGHQRPDADVLPFRRREDGQAS